MDQKHTVINILKYLKSQLTTQNLKEKYYHDRPELFSRKRKLDLPGIITFILKKSMKSYDLQIEEIQDKFQLWKEGQPTKQAVSKARQKVDWKIFADFLFQEARIFLEDKLLHKLWEGYHIYAIDGSDCEVPTTKETLSFFGNISYKKASASAGATTSAVVDVMNGFILDASIAPYKTSERRLAIEHCEKMCPYISTENSIFLCDRGYPSYDFLGYFHDNNLKYVMRVKKQFTQMRTPGQKEGEVYLKLRGKMRTVRTIEVELENGTTEYLITNLKKTEMVYDKFQELYFLRWAIEGKYQELKNRLMLEEFSGKTINNIQQDYYASVFLSNISALVKNAADDIIQKEYRKSSPKYQANRSYVTGCMNTLLELILRHETDIYRKIEQLVEKAERKRSLIRPNRKNERNQNLTRRKHQMHYKPCI